MMNARKTMLSGTKVVFGLRFLYYIFNIFYFKIKSIKLLFRFYVIHVTRGIGLYSLFNFN